MFATTRACTVLGSDAVPVVVEASEERGLPAIVIIGLRATERVETRERIRCGLAALGVDIGLRRIVVSVAPADLPKSGAALDLPIAIAVLAALGHVPSERVAGIASHGELGLDGGLRAADGVVASAFAAVRSGAAEFIVPRASAARAALAPMAVVHGDTLAEVVAHLRGTAPLPVASAADMRHQQPHDVDLGDVRAQRAAVEAMVVAAAGGHNALLFGAPGCGKTMLAHRLPTILPRLDPQTALEVATIHDAAGLRERELDDRPPFRAPHHSVTSVALVGGGAGRPVVGEVTLAHRGVLFLDELPEYRPSALDGLRQPLEDAEVRIRRAGWIARYPCDTQVVAAMNLCRCGRYGIVGGAACTCSDASRTAYRERVSGAIVDRFDVRVRMRPSGSILHTEPTMDSADALELVTRARERQRERWGGARLNGSVQSIRDSRLSLDPAARARVERLAAAGSGGRLQRAVVRVARTVADLDDRAAVTEDDVLQSWELCRTQLGAADD